MTRHNVKPHSEEWFKLRHQDLTATETSAFYDPKAHKTQLQLYYEKRASTPPPAIQPHDPNYIRVEAGKYLEPFVGRIFQEKYGHELHNFDGYARHDVERMGASPDLYHAGLQGTDRIYEVRGSDGLTHPITMADGPGIVEVKTSSYLQYGDTYTDGEPPLKYIVQLMHQMACTGYKWGMIITLVDLGEIDVAVYRADPRAIRDLERRVRKFWWHVDHDKEPEASDREQDAKLIKELYPNLDHEPTDMSDDSVLFDICSKYVDANIERKKHEREVDDCKNRAAQIIKAHAHVVCGPFRLKRSKLQRPEMLAWTDLDTNQKVRMRVEDLEEDSDHFQIACDMIEKGQKTKKVGSLKYEYMAEVDTVTATIKETM